MCGRHHAAHWLHVVDDAAAAEVHGSGVALAHEEQHANGGHDHKCAHGDQHGSEVTVVAVAESFTVGVRGVFHFIGRRHEDHVDDVNHAVGGLDVRQRDVCAVENGAISHSGVVAVDHGDGQAIAEVCGHH